MEVRRWAFILFYFFFFPNYFFPQVRYRPVELSALCPPAAIARGEAAWQGLAGRAPQHQTDEGRERGFCLLAIVAGPYLCTRDDQKARPVNWTIRLNLFACGLLAVGERMPSRISDRYRWWRPPSDAHAPPLVTSSCNSRGIKTVIPFPGAFPRKRATQPSQPPSHRGNPAGLFCAGRLGRR